MKKLLLAIWLCSIPATVTGTASLCDLEERSLFTCSIGKKLVSVCASKDLTATSGYVQYRFGQTKNPPELVYPAERTHPASSFGIGFTGSAKSSLVNLNFKVSPYSYTIYSQAAAFDTNGAGIRIKAPGSKTSRLSCKEESPPNALNTLHNLELRVLPHESLISVEDVADEKESETWSAESPNIDLLQGVRAHDFALVLWALDHGADVNFHTPFDVGVLGALVDGRPEAIRYNRIVEFDEETDKLLTLLLSRGISPVISTQNGVTLIEFLANRAPSQTVRTLLDAGWPRDYQYRLYVGALLGDPILVKDALDRGADATQQFHNSSLKVPAISRASQLINKGEEPEQRKALAALELLLKAGARINEGDITRVYSYSGNHENIRPVLELLVLYATPAARNSALTSLQTAKVDSYPIRKANLDWLLKRLQH